MLYEKTLSRKVVSVSSKAVSNSDHGNLENGNGKDATKHEEQSSVRKLFMTLLSPFRAMCGRRSKDKKKMNLASMGKIMNLMR